MAIEVQKGTIHGSRQRTVTVKVGTYSDTRLVFGGSPDHLVRITVRDGNTRIGGDVWAISHADARALGEALIALADGANSGANPGDSK